MKKTKYPDDSSSQSDGGRQELAMGTACMAMQKQDDPADGVNRIIQWSKSVFILVGYLRYISNQLNGWCIDRTAKVINTHLSQS